MTWKSETALYEGKQQTGTCFPGKETSSSAATLFTNQSFHLAAAISNSFGIGGHNSVAVFSAFKP